MISVQNARDNENEKLGKEVVVQVYISKKPNLWKNCSQVASAEELRQHHCRVNPCTYSTKYIVPVRWCRLC
jgi:V8-like Glu-specific endopeptidase